MSAHVYFECEKPCEKAHCMFCDGGLGYCTVCVGAEASLTSECCGRKLTDVEEARAALGVLDFKGGVWIERALENGKMVDKRTWPEPSAAEVTDGNA